MSAEKPAKRRATKSKIPGIGSDSAARGTGIALDSVTTTLESFYTTGTVIGTDHSYGADIQDNLKEFYSLREPVAKWWICSVADDIFDNWFRVKDVDKPDNPSLDNAVQKVLTALKAKVQLPRLTLFERRYGYAILLLSYTGFNNSWETPLFTPRNGEIYPKLGKNEQILQITPYPKNAIDHIDVDEDEGSLRRGLPLFYHLNIGSVSSSEGTLNVGGGGSTIKVHWTRVIHDAPRLDEHPFEGISAIDCIFDDLVGGRNARWGMYQGYYRNGQGFPVFHTKGTKAENEAWVAAGGVNDVMNARGYFICGEDEDMRFEGAQASALNPGSYFDTYFTFIAAATGVSQDTIKGVSAGRVSGSEVNERQYFKSITLQQRKKEPMLRELIDRLIQTGQVEFSGDYFIDWIDPFMVNPQDKASIEYLQERTNALRGQTETVDEVRARKGMPPLPNGEGKHLQLQPGQFGSPAVVGAANQQGTGKPSDNPGDPTQNGPDSVNFIYELKNKESELE